MVLQTVSSPSDTLKHYKLNGNCIISIDTNAHIMITEIELFPGNTCDTYRRFPLICQLVARPPSHVRQPGPIQVKYRKTVKYHKEERKM